MHPRLPVLTDLQPPRRHQLWDSHQDACPSQAMARSTAAFTAPISCSAPQSSMLLLTQGSFMPGEGLTKSSSSAGHTALDISHVLGRFKELATWRKNNSMGEKSLKDLRQTCCAPVGPGAIPLTQTPKAPHSSARLLSDYPLLLWRQTHAPVSKSEGSSMPSNTKRLAEKATKAWHVKGSGTGQNRRPHSAWTFAVHNSQV